MKKLTDPLPPEGLSQESQVLWRKTLETWQLPDVTLLVCLENALRCLDRLRNAEAIVAKEGPVVKDAKSNQLKQHPATLAVRDEGRAFREYLKMLNLDYSQLMTRR
jgi:phage terminase small subunit